MIKILIVDDHQISAYGIRAMLMHDSDLSVIGIVNSGAEALDFLAANEVDVVLLDYMMPEVNGFETLIKIRELFPGTKVIMLTVSDDKEIIIECLAFRVEGFIFKDIKKEDMAIAIKKVYNNGYAFSQKIFEIIINFIFDFAFVQYQELKERGGKNNLPGKYLGKLEIKEVLTSREYEVLILVAKGKSTTEIAEELNISKFTVNAYRKNLYTKLGVTKLTDLNKIAQNELEKHKKSE